LGQDLQEVGAIRESDSRGRHTTTARELLVLPGGAMVIDTPGLREFAVVGRGGGSGRDVCRCG